MVRIDPDAPSAGATIAGTAEFWRRCLPDGDVAFIVSDVVDKLDTSAIHESESADAERTGARCDPLVMTKLVLYAPYLAGALEAPSEPPELQLPGDDGWRFLANGGCPTAEEVRAFFERHRRVLMDLSRQFTPLFGISMARARRDPTRRQRTERRELIQRDLEHATDAADSRRLLRELLRAQEEAPLPESVRDEVLAFAAMPTNAADRTVRGRVPDDFPVDMQVPDVMPPRIVREIYVRQGRFGRLHDTETNHLVESIDDFVREREEGPGAGPRSELEPTGPPTFEELRDYFGADAPIVRALWPDVRELIRVHSKDPLSREAREEILGVPARAAEAAARLGLRSLVTLFAQADVASALIVEEVWGRRNRFKGKMVADTSYLINRIGAFVPAWRVRTARKREVGKIPAPPPTLGELREHFGADAPIVKAAWPMVNFIVALARRGVMSTNEEFALLAEFAKMAALFASLGRGFKTAQALREELARSTIRKERQPMAPIVESILLTFPSSASAFLLGRTGGIAGKDDLRAGFGASICRLAEAEHLTVLALPSVARDLREKILRTYVPTGDPGRPFAYLISSIRTGLLPKNVRVQLRNHNTKRAGQDGGATAEDRGAAEGLDVSAIEIAASTYWKRRKGLKYNGAQDEGGQVGKPSDDAIHNDIEQGKARQRHHDPTGKSKAIGQCAATLSETYGVSRTTVFNAYRKAVRAGEIEARPRRTATETIQVSPNDEHVLEKYVRLSASKRGLTVAAAMAHVQRLFEGVTKAYIVKHLRELRPVDMRQHDRCTFAEAELEELMKRAQKDLRRRVKPK